jgi:hypothetical protein
MLDRESSVVRIHQRIQFPTVVRLRNRFAMANLFRNRRLVDCDWHVGQAGISARLESVLNNDWTGIPFARRNRIRIEQLGTRVAFQSLRRDETRQRSMTNHVLTIPVDSIRSVEASVT